MWQTLVCMSAQIESAGMPPSWAMIPHDRVLPTTTQVPTQLYLVPFCRSASSAGISRTSPSSQCSHTFTTGCSNGNLFYMVRIMMRAFIDNSRHTVCSVYIGDTFGVTVGSEPVVVYLVERHTAKTKMPTHVAPASSSKTGHISNCPNVSTTITYILPCT